jgi:hypothetical protein
LFFFKEVFKNNFLLISEGGCGAESMDLLRRNNVTIIDLVTGRKYKIDLGHNYLSRTKEIMKYLHDNTKQFYSISHFSLDDKQMIIYNPIMGLLSYNMVEIIE